MGGEVGRVVCEVVVGGGVYGAEVDFGERGGLEDAFEGWIDGGGVLKECSVRDDVVGYRRHGDGCVWGDILERVTMNNCDGYELERR